MSLLILDSTEDRMQLVQEIFDRQFKQDKKLSSEYDDYRKRQMLKDISYNLECLETALNFKADGIFTDYTRWIFELLAIRMKDLGENRVREQMIHHYQILGKILTEKTYSEKKKIFPAL